MSPDSLETNAPFSLNYAQASAKEMSRERQEAWTRYKKLGLPNHRLESWRYTDFRTACSTTFEPADKRIDHIVLDREHDSFRLVLIDGLLRHDLSDLNLMPDGVKVENINDNQSKLTENYLFNSNVFSNLITDSIVDLNTALASDGYLIKIEKDIHLTKPIEILNVITKQCSVFTRILIDLSENSRTQLIDTIKNNSSQGAQINHVLSVKLAQDSDLSLFSYLSGSGFSCTGVSTLLSELGRGASLNSHLLFDLNGFFRRQVFAKLNAERANITLNGIVLGKNKDHIDNTIFIEHCAPNTTSNEVFRYILNNNSIGVFQGKIIVRPTAQKSDGFMQSKAILLSELASMNSKPELEIFADDVKCSHGSTCGEIDKEQLFYLMSRGLDEQEALSLLIESFAFEAFSALNDDTIADFTKNILADWLYAERQLS
jgi:Fe-S cluster assembly protein SufD